MPNHTSPKTIDEVIETLQAGFDEENHELRRLPRKELEEELLSRGINIERSFGRIQKMLEEMRDNLPAKPLSPLESLYQRCRAIPGALREDVLGIVQALQPEKVSQAEAYAATIDPHDRTSVERFRQKLAKLNDAPTDKKS